LFRSAFAVRGLLFALFGCWRCSAVGAVRLLALFGC